mmetsp:Transcript_59513/g.66617  ORF Transcript_59513/g.66617 Transcript_59513/m.66617 type:complete len:260 (+) Transcript_59513:220-999(+)
MPPTVQETEIEGQQRTTKLSYIQSFLPSIFGTSAIILGTGANAYCETVKFSQVQGNNDLVLYAGPWSYRTTESYEWQDSMFAYQSCRNYDNLKNNLGFDYTVDATTKTVWAFSIITPLFGSLLVFGVCLGSCFGSPTLRKKWKCMGAMFVLVSIFQGMTLLIESSSICYNNPAVHYLEMNNPELAATLPEKCEWAIGFKVNIAAVVLWILAGVCALSFPPQLVIHEHTHQEQTVTYTQNDIDGTVQENHITIIKGTPVA